MVKICIFALTSADRQKCLQQKRLDVSGSVWRECLSDLRAMRAGTSLSTGFSNSERIAGLAECSWRSHSAVLFSPPSFCLEPASALQWIDRRSSRERCLNLSTRNCEGPRGAVKRTVAFCGSHTGEVSRQVSVSPRNRNRLKNSQCKDHKMSF